MKKRLGFFADTLTSEQQFSARTTKLLAIAFLIAAASLCFLTYTSPKYMFFKSKISISPDLISGVASLAMLAPLYARGILKWSRSIYGLVTLVLLWTVYAAIIQIALQGKSNIPEYLVAAAAILSWLGMRGVAGFAWVIAFVACIISIVQTNAAMGIYGYIFIVTAFLGCSLHSGLGPSDLIRNLTDEFHRGSKPTRERIAEDVNAAGDLGGKLL